MLSKEELKFIILTNCDCSKFSDKELDDVTEDMIRIVNKEEYKAKNPDMFKKRIANFE